MSGQVFMAVPVVYVLLQWLALRRMQEGWKVAALVPAIATLAAFAIFVISMVANASMGAMWFVLALPLAAIYLAVLIPLHWLLDRPRRAPKGRVGAN